MINRVNQPNRVTCSIRVAGGNTYRGLTSTTADSRNAEEWAVTGSQSVM